MKISQDNLIKNINNETDFMLLINNLQDQYGEVYWNNIDNQMFVYRALGRLEYKEILSSEISDIEKEDVVCQACLLYPENYNFDDCAAGIPTQLFKLILKNSFLDSIDSKKLIIAYHRAEMEQFDNQITCIINEAFPNFDIEEIENWDMSKTAKYLSRAEWKLNVLRQIPVDYEISDRLMENEWNIQHISKEQLEEIKKQNANNNQPLQETSNNEKDKNFKVETLEERQSRMKNEGPKKKSPEELARLKKAFPDIDWDAQVSVDDLKDNVDTLAPALRPGW